VHLVISTLHTNDAPSAINRLLELGVPHYLLRNTIVGVIAQRLIRSLCPHCAAPAAIAEDEWRGLTQPCQLELPSASMIKVGCKECRDTGYRGRLGIYEVMEMTASLRQKIIPEVDIDILRQQAMQDGMEPLRVSGARKVAAGMTTMAEVLRVAPADT
jgi:general secretion pathway protein E